MAELYQKFPRVVPGYCHLAGEPTLASDWQKGVTGGARVTQDQDRPPAHSPLWDSAVHPAKPGGSAARSTQKPVAAAATGAEVPLYVPRSGHTHPSHARLFPGRGSVRHAQGNLPVGAAAAPPPLRTRYVPPKERLNHPPAVTTCALFGLPGRGALSFPNLSPPPPAPRRCPVLWNPRPLLYLTIWALARST